MPAARPAARALALLLVLLAPGLAVAASDPGAALPTLRREQALAWGIVRDFHMQTLTNGDAGRAKTLKDHVDAAQKDADALPGATGNAAFDAAVTAARDAWPAFRKAALANRVQDDGYTDDNLVGDLYTSANTLVTALGKAIAAVPAAGPQRAAQDKAHDANVLLQRTVAGYLKRSAQMSPDIGAEDDFDIGKATQALDRQLGALGPVVKGDKDAEQLLRGVNTKWQFIRGSLLKYNEKAVPYITDRYAQQISDGLTRIEERLEARK